MSRWCLIKITHPKYKDDDDELMVMKLMMVLLVSQSSAAALHESVGKRNQPDAEGARQSSPVDFLFRTGGRRVLLTAIAVFVCVFSNKLAEQCTIFHDLAYALHEVLLEFNNCHLKWRRDRAGLPKNLVSFVSPARPIFTSGLYVNKH